MKCLLIPQAREVIGPNVILDGPVLRITNAMVNDRGMYICTAQNDAGSAQAAAIVEVESMYTILREV